METATATAAKNMTAEQANEWLANHVDTINTVIARKGWDHNEATVAQVSGLILGECLAGGKQGQRVAVMTLAAMQVAA